MGWPPTVSGPPEQWLLGQTEDATRTDALCGTGILAAAMLTTAEAYRKSWLRGIYRHTPGMVVHACNPSTGETEAGRWATGGSSGPVAEGAQCGSIFRYTLLTVLFIFKKKKDIFFETGSQVV